MKQRISKTLFILLISLMLFNSPILFAQNRGDANGDKSINVIDALVVAQFYVGMKPDPFFPELADVDCSGIVTIVDALLLAQYYVGIIKEFCTPQATTANPTPSIVPIDHDHVDNPYENAKMYINPVWSEKARSSVGYQIASISTSVELNRTKALTDGIGLRGHLDEALSQKADVITFVISNLPYKYCERGISYDSNPDNITMEVYQKEFIDPLVAIMGDPIYSGLRIVCIIEPGTLSNLIFARHNIFCNKANGPDGFIPGIQYTLDQLNTLENTYCYLDIANSAHLGWTFNFSGAVELYARVVKATSKGVNSLSGFITNYENYMPLEEPFLPNPDFIIEDTPIRASDFYEWNPRFGELHYAQAWRQAMINQGFPETIGMLIDTARNGWGGPERPTAQSTSKNLNDFVNQSRIDRRHHRLNWCNQPGGIGERPQANPAPGIDAYIWGRPPGESDGFSDSKFICDCLDPPIIDIMCYFGGQSTYALNYSNGAIEAPFRGRWNELHLKMLIENAYPPLEVDD